MGGARRDRAAPRRAGGREAQVGAALRLGALLGDSDLRWENRGRRQCLKLPETCSSFPSNRVHANTDNTFYILDLVARYLRC
jgi:hypothetical protein